MSSLKFVERKALEGFFGMSGGYVLDFKNASFREFIEESVNLNPDDERFGTNGSSKANRLRALWKLESDAVVGRLLHALIDYAMTVETKADGTKEEDERKCRQIAVRLCADRNPSTKPQRASIFISYRRDDASAEARLVFDRLEKSHGSGAVFMDVSSISPGARWPREIEENLASAATVIAVIGPQWLLAGADQWGKRRIDDESDWVRRELEEALQKEKRLIPLLVKGANVPPASALPESLKELFQRQCVEVRRDYWDHDIGLLEVALAAPEPSIAMVPPRSSRERTDNSQTPAAIKRERDLEQLRKVFHWIHLGVLDDYIDRMANYARATNAGTMMFDRLRDVVGSSRFYLNDMELRSRLDAFMRTWGSTQRHIHEMEPDRRGVEFLFYMPGDLFQSRQQKKHVKYVMGQAPLMRSALDRFVGYVREHFVEIDPNECGFEALKEYEIEEAATKEMLRLQRALDALNDSQ